MPRPIIFTRSMRQGGKKSKVQSPRSKVRRLKSKVQSPRSKVQRMPLLHKMLSRLGPGVAWCDLDGDGHEELIIGCGKGGKLAVFRTDGKGGLTPWRAEAWNAPAPDDLTSVISWTAAGQQRSLLAGVSSYEQPDNTPAAVWRFDVASEANKD